MICVVLRMWGNKWESITKKGKREVITNWPASRVEPITIKFGFNGAPEGKDKLFIADLKRCYLK